VRRCRLSQNRISNPASTRSFRNFPSRVFR
jgi:hypothetical protein